MPASLPRADGRVSDRVERVADDGRRGPGRRIEPFDLDRVVMGRLADLDGGDDRGRNLGRHRGRGETLAAFLALDPLADELIRMFPFPPHDGQAMVIIVSFPPRQELGGTARTGSPHAGRVDLNPGTRKDSDGSELDARGSSPEVKLSRPFKTIKTNRVGRSARRPRRKRPRVSRNERGDHREPNRLSDHGLRPGYAILRMRFQPCPSRIGPFLSGNDAC